MTRTRRIVLTAVLAALSLVTSGLAVAAWQAVSGGAGYTRANTVPAGTQPALSASGGNVTVSWTAVTFSDGSAVDGYAVHRYRTSDGVEFAVGANCSGTITGTSCTENGVPSGSWTYRVEPVHASWRGAEGTGSSTTIGSAQLAGLQILNGTGMSGKADPGDTIVVTYGDLIDVSSFCSSWSGNASDQSITADNVVTVQIQSAAVNGHDKVVVSTSPAACGGSFRWGYIDLGSNGYVNPQGASFSGNGANASTITWSASQKTLTIKLGALTGNSSRVNSTITAIYSPDPANTSNGSPITGTISDSGIHF